MSTTPLGEGESAGLPVEIPAEHSDVLLNMATGILLTLRENVTPGGEPSEEALSNVETRLNQLREGLLAHAAADPANQPDSVIARVVAQYKSIDPYANRPVTSFDQAVSRYTLNTHRLREADLAPYDEAALLKAAVIAGINRGTRAGQLLARRAINILRHETSNTIYPPRDESETEARRFITQYSRIVFAIQAFEELSQRETVKAPTSLEEVLRAWANLRPELVVEESDPLTPYVAFEEDGEERVQFRPLLQMEAEERLKGLRVIGESLKEMYGEDAQVRYFETVVFEDADEISVPEGSRTKDETESGNSDESDDNHESSQYFTSDYIVAEVTRQTPTGERIIDIVAESPNYGNACYVLRGDMLQSVSEVFDEAMDWRDVFRYFKVTARQLGAVNFRHYSGSNVPKNVLTYLSTDIALARDRFAQRWLTKKSAIYDTAMEPTRFNRLPLSMRNKVAGRKEAAKALLKSWLEEAVVLDLSDETLATLGSPLVAKTVETDASPEQIPEEASRRINELEQENQSLTDEVTRLEDEKAALEAKLEQLRVVLGSPV